MPKTRLEILNDIEDELCANIPVHILPSDTNFNDKWYSEEEIKDDLEVFIEEQLSEGYEEDIVRDFVRYLFKPKQGDD